MPVKTRPWILFSARRNVFMSGHMGDGVVAAQKLAKLAQLLVLGRFKVPPFQAFEFNAHRVVVAVGAAPVLGLPGMPSPVIGADELPEAAIALDVEMRRHLQSPNLREIRMCVPVQLVGEEVLHLVTAKLARWQADGVDHQQIDASPRRS